MTRDEIQKSVLKVLLEIAPEADLDRLRPDLPLREQLDIDSMDQLRFLVALHQQLGIDIPEADYPKLTSLAACLDYLQRRAADSKGQHAVQ
jgi:acyl carrier protein